MILYYAIGGGLGHLTRGRRVLAALGLEATLVTASPYAEDARVTGGLPVIRVPAELEGDAAAHRAWVRSLRCERMLVDTFPCGIQGELSGLDVPMDLVARRLRWEEYRRAVPAPLPRFGTVYEVEDFRSAVAAERVVRCELRVAGGASEAGDEWLIVHSGPEEEVRELIAYAQELQRLEGRPARTLVATRCAVELPPGFERIDAYPVTHLFPGAARIISAAGFNVMLETEPWRDKHSPVPFARRFDDQFARARARRPGVRWRQPPLWYGWNAAVPAAG